MIMILLLDSLFSNLQAITLSLSLSQHVDDKPLITDDISISQPTLLPITPFNHFLVIHTFLSHKTLAKTPLGQPSNVSSSSLDSHIPKLVTSFTQKSHRSIPR